jgi:hypothetical protein
MAVSRKAPSWYSQILKEGPKRLRLVTAVLTMSLALLSRSTYAQEPDWTWQNPVPQGNHLRGVWGSSGSDVFAVGDDGTILHYDGS